MIAVTRKSFNEKPGEKMPIGNHNAAAMTEESRQWAKATQALLLHPHRRVPTQWPQHALRQVPHRPSLETDGHPRGRMSELRRRTHHPSAVVHVNAQSQRSDPTRAAHSTRVNAQDTRLEDGHGV